jgi:hypothetical protein
MSQLTARTVDDVLQWIETTPHHRAAHDGYSDRDKGFFVLDGHGERLRIPASIRVEAMRFVQPGGEFDKRMFRATPAGKARLTRARRATASPTGDQVQ